MFKAPSAPRVLRLRRGPRRLPGGLHVRRLAARTKERGLNMRMRRRRVRWTVGMAAVVAVLALSAPQARPQNTGSITGVARDTSGAVLPGVTVEASSPALIEKVRVALTDGQGRF